MSTIDNETGLTAAECAARTGLTVRALRVYEDYGLIQPNRTASGWRVYGTRELIRLNTITLLKSAGLTLAQIKSVTRFSDTDPSLAHVLQLQVDAWKSKQEAALRGQALAEAALKNLHAHNSLSIDELCNLVRTLEMSEQNSDAAPSACEVQEIKINPAVLDRYVGAYRAGEYEAITITRGDTLFIERPGVSPHKLLAQNDTDFFAPAVNAYCHFEIDAQGRVTELVIYQNGIRFIAPRIDAAIAEEVKSKLATKIAAQTPNPNSEAALRRLLESIRAGEPIYGEMSALIAKVIRQQLPMLHTTAKYLGAIKSIEFRGVGNKGFDVYNVHCEHGDSQWRIDVTANGVIDRAMTFSSDGNPLQSMVSSHDTQSTNSDPEHVSISQAVLRRYVIGTSAGAPNYDEMTPLVAYAIKRQLPQLQALSTRLGELVDIEHVSSELQRFDVFDVKSEHGTKRMRISVNDDGAITSVTSVITASTPTAGP